jgi:DNA-binding transcriptional LysR family regulator
VLDLNEISMFVEVGKAGSFAEASRRLRIPPSRMSRKIQQLEDRLGTHLLRRSTRKDCVAQRRDTEGRGHNTPNPLVI